MALEKRGKWQRMALEAALSSYSEGYTLSRVWSVAPTAIYACVTKGWLELSSDRTRAKLKSAKKPAEARNAVRRCLLSQPCHADVLLDLAQAPGKAS